MQSFFLGKLLRVFQAVFVALLFWGFDGFAASAQSESGVAVGVSVVSDSDVTIPAVFSPEIRGLLEDVLDGFKARTVKRKELANTPSVPVEIERGLGEVRVFDVAVSKEEVVVQRRYEHLRSGFDALRVGQYEVAVSFYREVLQQDSHNVDALFGLAVSYHRGRQFDQARDVYATLLRVEPGHEAGMNNFLMLLRDAMPGEVHAVFEALIKEHPYYAPLFVQMAMFHADQGQDLERAIGYMEHAVALEPNDLSYRYNMAVLLDRAKRFTLAAQLYRQLIKASLRGEQVPGSVRVMEDRLLFIYSQQGKS